MRLQLLRELVPGLHRIAVIVRSDPGLEQKLQNLRGNAERIGIEVLMLEANTGRALEFAFGRLPWRALRGRLCGLRSAGSRQASHDHLSCRGSSPTRDLLFSRLSR